jgi:hypothetical protein
MSRPERPDAKLAPERAIYGADFLKDAGGFGPTAAGDVTVIPHPESPNGCCRWQSDRSLRTENPIA